MSNHPRPPISARHAFARAFDLAVRRDPVQSLWVPLLLHAPWLLIRALVPSPDDPGGLTVRNLQLNSLQLLGDFPVSLLIASMLRFRALSVHGSTDGMTPAPARECYARGARRMPWLFATELLRNAAIVVGLVAVLPALWVGFRFSLATEVAVLRPTGVLGSFTRSYHLTQARLERWLEMIAMSVLLVLAVLFTCAVCFLVLPSTTWSLWLTVALFLFPLVMSVIQYAWTFFFLRLDELDEAEEGSGGELPRGRPRLMVVEGGRPEEPRAPKAPMSG